ESPLAGRGVVQISDYGRSARRAAVPLRIARAADTPENQRAIIRLREEASEWLSFKRTDQWQQPWPNRRRRDARIRQGLKRAATWIVTRDFAGWGLGAELIDRRACRTSPSLIALCSSSSSFPPARSDWSRRRRATRLPRSW